MSSLSRRPTSSALGRSGSERDLSHTQRLSSRTSTKVQRVTSGMVRSTSNLEDASAKASYKVDFENTPGKKA